MRLFVYGSLAPGRPNEHVLSAVGGEWEEAVVKGTLHDEGWGASMGFPGIVLDEQGSDISGYLFSSENLSGHWAALDAFEGAAYRRVVAKARRKDGSWVEVYVYALSGS